MNEVTRMLSQIADGDAQAASQLLPLVYDELRRLAAQRLANERQGYTLNATALVHEAYLRLVGSDDDQRWNGREHFFAMAATAMRRILVERARRKKRAIHGGGKPHVELHADVPATPQSDDELLALDAALAKFAEHDPEKARLVELRYFAGLSGEEAAEAMGISARAADRHWVYARAWLRSAIDEAGEELP